MIQTGFKPVLYTKVIAVSLKKNPNFKFLILLCQKIDKCQNPMLNPIIQNKMDLFYKLSER